MSLTIDTLTISSIEDRRLCLSNASAARMLSIGNSWTTLRISMRYNFDDTGGNLTGAPAMFLGVMSNPTANLSNGPLTSATSHFVGIQTCVATWVRQTGPTLYYLQGANASRATRKIGAVSNQQDMAGYWHASASPSTIRTAHVVEIVKGSPSFTIQNTSPYNPSNTIVDMPKTGFDAGVGMWPLIDQAGWYFQWGGYGFNGIYSQVVNEAVDGPLNAVVVAWNQVTPIMRISDLTVTAQ